MKKLFILTTTISPRPAELADGRRYVGKLLQAGEIVDVTDSQAQSLIESGRAQEYKEHKKAVKEEEKASEESEDKKPAKGKKKAD